MLSNRGTTDISLTIDLDFRREFSIGRKRLLGDDLIFSPKCCPEIEVCAAAQSSEGNVMATAADRAFQAAMKCTRKNAVALYR